MPPRPSKPSRPSKLAPKRPAPRHDDLDNYNVDDLDNPFASPPPEASSKKRKGPDAGLGIDEEVTVQKRARAPAVKLDEARLLSPAGIPKLRKRAAGLKIKGKGHEARFQDAARLLSLYQLWLDDLFPKARFLDALAMVEKVGHKKKLMTARNEWINEGKPKSKTADDDDAPAQSARPAAKSSSSNQQRTSQTTSSTARPKTPPPPPQRDDIPDGDDLYDATPRASRPTNSVLPPRDDAPDEDDLEALMAEAEGADTPRHDSNKNTIHNNKRPSNLEPDGDDDDNDDLDALMAEAEAQDQQGSGAQQRQPEKTAGLGDEFGDDEEAMQEMEGLW